MEKFKDFSRSLISYYSSEVSLSRLAKIVEVDKKTIDLWSYGLENSYLNLFPPQVRGKTQGEINFQ
nr:hypothetical protein [Metallosphaera hakonensis]